MTVIYLTMYYENFSGTNYKSMIVAIFFWLFLNNMHIK